MAAVGVLAAVIVAVLLAWQVKDSPPQGEINRLLLSASGAASENVVLETPCGPVTATFSGEQWVQAGGLRPAYGDRVWHGATATGTLHLVSEDKATFVGVAGQEADFRPRKPGEQLGLCG